MEAPQPFARGNFDAAGEPVGHWQKMKFRPTVNAVPLSLLKLESDKLGDKDLAAGLKYIKLISP